MGIPEKEIAEHQSGTNKVGLIGMSDNLVILKPEEGVTFIAPMTGISSAVLRKETDAPTLNLLQKIHRERSVMERQDVHIWLVLQVINLTEDAETDCSAHTEGDITLERICIRDHLVQVVGTICIRRLLPHHVTSISPHVGQIHPLNVR